jgi:hypothetical protein
MSAGVALALTIVLLPVPGFLPIEGLRWAMPLVLLLLLAPWFFWRRIWRERDSSRVLVRLDKTLQLAERATTAWEFSALESNSAAHELVFKQAQERLAGVNPRLRFPRQWHWQSYAAGPLLVLWLALLWFEVDRAIVDQGVAPAPSLAHKLGQYSRELQEKAKSEGLSESLKTGQELERLARENLAAKRSEEQLKQELTSMAKKLEAAVRAGADREPIAAGESQQTLQDLKAELEAARELLNFADAAKTGQGLPQQLQERLTSLPQLKRQLDRGGQLGPGSGPNEMKSFLDRLERQTTGELDRRTLLEAQQFLEQMAQAGQAGRSENNANTAGRGEQEGDGEMAKEKNQSNRPGKEPGKKDDSAQSLPEYRGGAPTQVKGALGEGDSSAVGFKAKPAPGKSMLGRQEVATNYRRQAEQELDSERVPEALKETIRNYFLSLENSEPRK